MSNCPNCEYHKERARIWRQEAYKLSGHPLNDEQKQGANMTDREAMKMALEALKNTATRSAAEQYATEQNVIEALEAALAQPDETETLKRCLFQMQEAAKALAQPEQEPIAWRKKMSGVWHYFDESTPFPFDDCEPLYEKH